MAKILGIDPGKKGGLAILTDRDKLSVAAMPVKKLPNGKVEVDALRIYVALRKHIINFAAIEQVHAMPGQGVVSMFSFGQNYGTLLGVLDCLGIKTLRIEPSVWKSGLGLARDKEASLEMARKLFPKNGLDFSNPMCDGVAEAALIAHFAKKMLKL